LAEELSIDVGLLTGITAEQTAAFKDVNIDTVEDLATANEIQLAALVGIELKELEMLIATAQATLEEIRKQVEEMIEAEKAERAAEPLFNEAFAEGEEKKIVESELFEGALAEGAAKKPEEKKLTEEDIFGEKQD